jgi:D-xylose transport system substrate-binding protein
MKAAIEAAGGTYISTDAGSSAEQQLADVEQLISQGADALILLAQDGTAIKPAVASALDQGIPVIAYDRLIEDARALYITFDNVEVGRMQARAVFAVAPTGNYVFIKGNAADANADFLRQGQQEVLQAALDSGAIVNVGESYTDNWSPAVAQTNMEQFLTQNNNDVDAVVASNDGTAGGVITALAAQGLAGLVPVSGQDGDAAALNRIALGTQTVSVWKDARELGKKAGEAAIALAKGTAMADLPDTVMFASPGGNQMTSYLLTPVPITIDNLQVVIDAGWITVETLCQGVTAGTVDVCG